MPRKIFPGSISRTANSTTARTLGIGATASGGPYEYAQSPFFNYIDENGRQHEVWFEDARSIRAKLALVPEYGLRGAGYWNAMRHFPQNWLVLNALYDVRSV